MGAVKQMFHDSLELQRCAAEGEYENPWTPALIAFYRKQGCPQRAENLAMGWFDVDACDLHVIEALQAAFEVAPQIARVA